MPKITAAERRDRKIAQRKSGMRTHGRESINLIQQGIMKRANRKAKQKERERDEVFDD